jgi:hypothetical protein
MISGEDSRLSMFRYRQASISHAAPLTLISAMHASDRTGVDTLNEAPVMKQHHCRQ